MSDMGKRVIQKTNRLYWDIKGNDFLQAIVLPYYGAYISEEKWQLFGDVSGKKLLEIGCGNGQSLQYHGERNAAELWGVDISERQLEKAAQHLKSCGLSANLICSPMEEECGIPRHRTGGKSRDVSCNVCDQSKKSIIGTARYGKPHLRRTCERTG
jgi:SAM-dependent methyltransferase